MSDAMADLGNLPDKVKLVRNRRTGIEFVRDEMEWGTWENTVRYAFNHQDEMEMVLDKRNEIDLEALTDEPGVEVATGPLSIIDLRKMHWKKLQQHARSLNVATSGTKEQIIERVMAASTI